MLTLKVKGNYKHTLTWLTELKNQEYLSILDKYGKIGVEELRSYTPKDTGKTADSWYYEIEIGNNGSSICWKNRNKTYQGHPIAVLLQYGHGTGTGGYVQGIDYINPAIKPVFDKLVDDVCKEISSI